MDFTSAKGGHSLFEQPPFRRVSSAISCRSPTFGNLSKHRFGDGPVIDYRRIKLNSVRPYECSGFRIYTDSRKDLAVSETSIDLPHEERLKIDDPSTAVSESN